MLQRISKFFDQTIFISYLALAIVTPLLFSTQNSELFEVPKMMFVYFAAVLIFFSTLLKFLLKEKILVPKNLFLFSFLIFLIIQILSTLTSIDKFTSIFGYPTRLNGGLLSQIAYLVIMTGAIINFTSKQAQKIILSVVISAFAVSLWGIPAHFGKDPSCLILTGQLNSNCWQKEFDPTLRIFSTLGQPNWLASYLVLVIPLSLALIFLFKQILLKIFFILTSLALFLAFLFTNSRAGLIGLMLSLIIFTLLLGKNFIKKNLKAFSFPLIIFLLFGSFFGRTLI